MEKELILKVMEVLKNLSYNKCWCQVSIGNPMYKEHTQACIEAQKLFDTLEKEYRLSNFLQRVENNDKP